MRRLPNVKHIFFTCCWHNKNYQSVDAFFSSLYHKEGRCGGRERQGAGQAEGAGGVGHWSGWEKLLCPISGSAAGYEHKYSCIHYLQHIAALSVLLLYIYSTCLPLFGAALTKESTTCNSKKQFSKLQKVQNRALIRFAVNREYPTSQTNTNYTSPQTPHRSTHGFLRGMYKFGKPSLTFKSPYTPLTANLPNIQNFHSYFPSGLT